MNPRLYYLTPFPASWVIFPFLPLVIQEAPTYLEQLPGNEMNPDPAVLNDGLLENGDFPLGDISPQIQHSEVVESSDIVVAPVRRKKRTARVLHPDTTMELRNKDLANWNANYLANMKEASKQKNQHRVAQLAKKNAEYWMWGSGIGGIAARAQGVTGRTPFDRFVGDNLFQFFTGVNRQDAARSKRDRDSGIDEATQEESRRVRQRTEEAGQEVGRGQEDEDFFVADDDVELPREEQLALDHQQRLSEMPWNITASIRGSSAIPRSGMVTYSLYNMRQNTNYSLPQVVSAWVALLHRLHRLVVALAWSLNRHFIAAAN